MCLVLVGCGEPSTSYVSQRTRILLPGIKGSLRLVGGGRGERRREKEKVRGKREERQGGKDEIW